MNLPELIQHYRRMLGDATDRGKDRVLAVGFLLLDARLALITQQIALLVVGASPDERMPPPRPEAST